MQVKPKLVNLTTRALSESMNVQTMVAVIRNLFSDYDLHARTGFPESIPIPNKDAAKQIVTDVIKSDTFTHFINLLIEMHQDGLMGKKYNIAYIRDIIREIHSAGYIYDREFKMFVEDSSRMITQNWGVLRENETYNFTFLRLDIVGNSKLVRDHDDTIIQETYRDLHDIVAKSCGKRNGRIWNWEGDGGTVAFYFSNHSNFAAICGMEILQELYIYNLMKCKLKEQLRIRIAIHNGECEYKHDFESIKSPVLKEIVALESRYTFPNSATFSNTVYRNLNPVLTEGMEAIGANVKEVYHNYSLKWEE